MNEQNNNQDQQQMMLQQILEYSRKTHNYIKWQFIITIALIVLPLLGIVFAVPLIFSSLSSLTSVVQ
jgi:lipopolysaccharide/colanic/teichoic acid biosynthesis glycosyltransferase